MRSVINAMVNGFVNGRFDRTNVVGLMLRGVELLLSSCFCAACAPKAYAMAAGWKQLPPVHGKAHTAGPMAAAMSRSASWRPQQSSLGRLVAFARTT